MPLTTAGRDAIASLITGNSATHFDNTNARLGVGDGATAFSAAHTDLQGTNKFRKAMDATYPTVAANVMTFKSTYASAEANFAWLEWGIFNAAAAGTMLDRLVENNGTKLVGQTWVFQVTLTLNAA